MHQIRRQRNPIGEHAFVQLQISSHISGISISHDTWKYYHHFDIDICFTDRGWNGNVHVWIESGFVKKNVTDINVMKLLYALIKSQLLTALVSMMHFTFVMINTFHTCLIVLLIIHISWYDIKLLWSFFLAWRYAPHVFSNISISKRTILYTIMDSTALGQVNELIVKKIQSFT